MSFQALDQATLSGLQQKLEQLSKSFSAGYQGIQNAGRTGVSALAIDSVDPVIRTITLEDQDFMLTKDIPTTKASQTVYQYLVKTAVRSGVDLAGFEAMLPQEDASQYQRVAEVLKVYGIRKSITQMAQFVNEAGGYMADLEKENDLNAALAMAESMERDLYVGGDYFNDTDGEIDALVASDINGRTRAVRGIQANIREGDKSTRGIPGDFVGYGNNRSVVFNRKGGVMERSFLDKIVTAVRDSRGAVREAHCTTSQLAEFRATFFALERADLNSRYAINGAAITNDERNAVPIMTVGGNVDFIPTVFKYNILIPVAIVGSVGTPPSTPTITSAPAGASVIGSGSGFKEGEMYRYRIQACNISGKSAGSASFLRTIGAGEDDKPTELTWTGSASVEYYDVYRTPVESNGQAGTEFFCGKVKGASSGTLKFYDNNRMIPGLDSILFLPKDKNRAKLAILGNLLNKMQLGLKGLAQETVYSSYFGCLVDRPRSFALADNVYEQREGL